MIFFLLWASSLCVGVAFSQDTDWVESTHKDFRASLDRGCSGVKVLFEGLKDNGNNVFYILDFDEQKKFDTSLYPADMHKSNISPTTTFKAFFRLGPDEEAKIFKVIRYEQSVNGAARIDSLKMDIRPVKTLPVVTFRYCNNRRIALNFSQDDFYDRFLIELNPDGGDGYDFNIKAKDSIITLESDLKQIYIQGVFETRDENNTLVRACDTRNIPYNVEPLAEVKMPLVSIVEEKEEGVEVTVDSLLTGGSYDLQYSINGGTFLTFPETLLSESGQGGKDKVLVPHTPGEWIKFRVPYDECEVPDFSEEMGMVRVKTAITLPLESVNELTYSKNDDFERIALERDSKVIAESVPESGYKDSDLVCNKLYSYRWVGVKGKARSYSLPAELTARSEKVPEALNWLSVSAVDGQPDALQLEWDSPEDETVSFYQVFDDNGSRNVKANATSVVIDGLRPSERSYDFEIRYRNVCDVFSGSKPGKSIHLEADQLDPMRWDLAWNDPTGFSAGDGGEFGFGLERNLTPPETDNIEVLPVAGMSGYTTRNDLTSDLVSYRIRVPVPEREGMYVYSNTQMLKFEVIIRFPNAFSPNRDGLNDRFNFVGLNHLITEYELTIFNRWGALVYQTDDKEKGWNGTVNGIIQPEGVYTYKAVITDIKGHVNTYSGSLVLVKGAKRF
ncbi:T9SS type B sorting domain-containing protein [Fulvitalea axinellae]|uniref:T9SS type B sorting domain-containing protein n=1 Tax=Fulvitalea axinellae TaxID=1182444 RepID=UPI0030CA591D